MASYGYEAIDKTGKEVKGSIEAETMEKARTDLKGQGMTVLNLTEQNALTKDINIDFGGKPTARDLGVFCRQFVSMNKAGVTILAGFFSDFFKAFFSAFKAFLSFFSFILFSSFIFLSISLTMPFPVNYSTVEVCAVSAADI